jgi:alpha-galactosidase/6-phospho-beta-glucosidase family protein
MKIAFIGGGSVQWTTMLVTDMAMNPALAGAELVLHDIDADALALMTRASRRVVEQLDGKMTIAAAADRGEALRDANFVILCVAVGGLGAMRQDLAIPERYGIIHAVGDTVGPAGLIRGLRHIPFAVQVAREVERLCPDAWLLNLTNPMTTICRGITRATGVRTIGLCHETDLFRRNHLASLFNVPPESIVLEVAGINHLPAILRFRLGDQDGAPALRRWLDQHGPFEFVADHLAEPHRDVFKDRLAVKLSLFEQLGVLFGAGDRHLAEFFPRFLSEASDRGARYGVLLTTIEHRATNARARRAWVERFLNGERAKLEHSAETLAPVMAALAGGPPGRFVVNVPNVGQIDNLPRDAVVECVAEVDSLGVRPVAVGTLAPPLYAAFMPHVAWQELVVEAALTGHRSPARAAMAIDPLVRDPAIVDPMLDELLAANTTFVESAVQRVTGTAGPSRR